VSFNILNSRLGLVAASVVLIEIKFIPQGLLGKF